MNSSKKRINFQSWDMSDLEIPKRSKIYSVQPIGLGSINVECLTSYLHRIARMHSVSFTTFIKHTLSSYLIEEQISDRAYTSRAYSINGINTIAIRVSNAMNELTLEDNKSELTLLKWREIFTSKEIQTNRKWCPACFEDLKINGLPLYEKLIWSIKIVNFCQLHNCSLQSNCLQCGAEQKYLNIKTEIGFCSNCKGYLGVSGMQDKKILSEEIDFHNWIHQSLTTLFRLGYDKRQVLNRNFIVDRIKTLLKTTLPNSKITKKDFSKHLGKGVRSLNLILEGRQSYSFESLLLLTYCANIPMNTFLTANLTEYKISSINTVSQNIVAKPSTNRKYSSIEIVNILRGIIEKNEDPPLNLGNIIKMLGYSNVWSLSSKFPEECRLISNRYKEYRNQLSNENYKLLEKELEKSIILCIENGEYPSQKLLGEILDRNGLFLIPEIYKKRAEIMERYGINTRHGRYY